MVCARNVKLALPTQASVLAWCSKSPLSYTGEQSAVKYSASFSRRSSGSVENPGWAAGAGGGPLSAIRCLAGVGNAGDVFLYGCE